MCLVEFTYNGLDLIQTSSLDKPWGGQINEFK